MSAASPATSPVRRSAAAPTRPAQSAQPAAARAAAPAFSFAASDVADEIKLHLGDIPRPQESMDVEGFKPSVLSRLLDLFAPPNKR